MNSFLFLTSYELHKCRIYVSSLVTGDLHLYTWSDPPVAINKKQGGLPQIILELWETLANFAKNMRFLVRTVICCKKTYTSICSKRHYSREVDDLGSQFRLATAHKDTQNHWDEHAHQYIQNWIASTQGIHNTKIQTWRHLLLHIRQIHGFHGFTFGAMAQTARNFTPAGQQQAADLDVNFDLLSFRKFQVSVSGKVVNSVSLRIAYVTPDRSSNAFAEEHLKSLDK